jgi:hypothetical protein
MNTLHLPARRALLTAGTAAVLCGVSLGVAQGAQFWFNGQLRTTVPDADFSRLFFGIWLAETTSEPRLRSALLAGAAG